MSAISGMTSAVADKKPDLYDCRDAYAMALEEMAERDARVCAVVNDSLSSPS